MKQTAATQEDIATTDNLSKAISDTTCNSKLDNKNTTNKTGRHSSLTRQWKLLACVALLSVVVWVLHFMKLYMAPIIIIKLTTMLSIASILSNVIIIALLYYVFKNKGGL